MTAPVPPSAVNMPTRVGDELDAGPALVFDRRKPAFFNAGAAVDVEQRQPESAEQAADGVDFGLPVKEVGAPLMAPVDVGETRFGEIPQRHLR